MAAEPGRTWSFSRLGCKTRGAKSENIFTCGEASRSKDDNRPLFICSKRLLEASLKPGKCGTKVIEVSKFNFDIIITLRGHTVLSEIIEMRLWIE